MNSDYFIKLTFNLFHTVEDWPETDFLKFQLRSLASQILNDLILTSNSSQIDGEIEVRLSKSLENLIRSLERARNQKLMQRQKFLLFSREYKTIQESLIEPEKCFKKELPVIKKKDETLIVLPKEKKKIKKTPIIKEVPAKVDFNSRQEKILKILEGRTKVQVWELKEVFTDISKRTLRRDLDELLKKGFIMRQGQWNEVSYELTKTKKG